MTFPSMNFHIFQIIAYISHPIELKLDQMIRDVESAQLFRAGFFDFLQGVLWGRASWNLQIGSQPTIFALNWIWILNSDEIGRMILDISLHNFWRFLRSAKESVQDFRIFRGRHIVHMFSRLAVARISISSIWEITAASVRRYLLSWNHNVPPIM